MLKRQSGLDLLRCVALLERLVKGLTSHRKETAK